MANIKSQIKRNKQSESARLRNKSAKSALKTHITKFEKAVAATDKEAAKTAMNTAIQALDKAAARKMIHPNNAANKKSRLAKSLKSLG